MSLASFGNENKDLYTPSTEVIEALDNLKKSMRKLHEYSFNRFMELSNKKNLNFQEEQELHALELVMFGSKNDIEDYLNFRKKIKGQKNEYQELKKYINKEKDNSMY